LSWEFPVIRGAASEYYGNKVGYTNEPIAAIGAWIIDQLEEKLYHQRTTGGKEVITYNWWNSIDPKRKLDMPAVAIDVDLIDDPQKMNFGIFQDGHHIAGDLMRGFITIVTLARSVHMRDMIDSHVGAVLSKVVNTETGHPIIYITKDEVPRDVNFSTTVDHMASTQFQVMSELGFSKITRYRFGVVRDHLSIYEYEDGSNEDDSQFLGLIRTYELDPDDAGHLPTWRSFKLTFTSDY